MEQYIFFNIYNVFQIVPSLPKFLHQPTYNTVATAVSVVRINKSGHNNDGETMRCVVPSYKKKYFFTQQISPERSTRWRYSQGLTQSIWRKEFEQNNNNNDVLILGSVKLSLLCNHSLAFGEIWLYRLLAVMWRNNL